MLVNPDCYVPVCSLQAGMHLFVASWFFSPPLSSVIFGEDVAFGGVFRCTVGLRDKYGKFLQLFFVFLFFELTTVATPFFFAILEVATRWQQSTSKNSSRLLAAKALLLFA